MQAIKSFLYLDEYKMYSISSQLFGGLTEYLKDTQETTDTEEEEQRGPLGSGRVMAGIMKSESKTEEKKYLHDYAYTLFESHLKDNDKVHSVSAENITATIRCIAKIGFVEVRAKAVFNDMKEVQGIIGNFNELGEALAYVTNFEELQKARQQIEALAESNADRNKRAQLRQHVKSLGNMEKLAKSQGLRQDPDFLQKLGYLLDYGFQDQFEIQMAIDQYTFSANLKREHLREKEHLLIRKYSRFPEQPFVLFGTIAQTPSEPSGGGNGEENTEDAEPQHLREALMAMVAALFQVESSFSGKLPNEIIIDPIALYSEI